MSREQNIEQLQLYIASRSK